MGDAVEDDDSVAQVDVIAGDADEALHQIQVGFAGFEEDDDVAAVGFAVMDERHPGGCGCEGDAVDEEMVADEEGFLHGAGGDDEVLAEEGEDE